MRYIWRKPVASIAKVYGLNPRTVANIMTLMRASRNEAKDERNERILAAYKAGERIADIARVHGLTIERALTIAVATGKAPRRRGHVVGVRSDIRTQPQP
jgi:hypothetical protein